MNKPNRIHLSLTATGIFACLSGTAGAEVLADARGDYQTTSAAGTTADFNGGEGLSDTEGSGRWNYLDGGGSLLTFGGAGNAGQSMYATVGQPNSLPALGDQQMFSNVVGPDADEIQWHAGNPLAAVMRWTAGVPVYNLEITGDIARSLTFGGDVQFDILVDGVNEFSVAVADTTLAPFNLTGLSIGAGEHVEFILSRGTGDNNTADLADLQATISGDTTPPAISITSFTATPSTLADSEDPVTFDWTVTGMPLDSLVITPGNIDVLGQTSYLLDPGPDGTTEYTLTATKGGDTVTSLLTVTLPAPVITSFTATPSAVESGEPVTLSVQVGLPVTTLTVDPGGIPVSVDGGGAGSIIVNPTETTTYTLTATRGTSTSTAEATAAVYDPANLFSEDFDGITGLGLNGGPGGQVTTTHDIGFGGSLTGWSKSGAGTIHAVDTANTWTDSAVSTNTPNWGVMIWQDNVITQDAGIPASNDSGIEYSIDFLAAGAVYTSAGQVNNGTTDGLKVEVLRASDDAVLHTFTQVVAQPVGVGDLGLTPYSFNYTGDGSGDIKFRIGPVNAGQGRFQGTIDDLLLSVDAGGGNDFSDWIAGFNVGAQTGIDDDPDNDGVDSGVENFFGTAPDESTQGLVTGAVDTGAGTFTFTHPQTGTLADDLTATYQWSVDLANFFADGVQDGGVQVDFVATPNSPSPGTTTVVATVTGPVPEKLFVSVKVTQP